MQQRDPDGVETSAIAALVSLDGKRAVDVGCGTGRLTSLAAAHAAAVYAFDPDGDSVAKAEAPAHCSSVHEAGHQPRGRSAHTPAT